LSSFFTIENLSDIPSADNVFTDRIMTDELSNILIDEITVGKTLDKLRHDEAAGADDLSP